MIAGEAANGEEGAEVIRRLSPDIIVTDLKMPRMDGVEMIAKLREQGNRAKFIILTAYGDFKYAQSAVKLGVSDYLLKPLKDGDLEQAVTRIIDQLEEGDRLRQKEEEETPIFRFNADRKAKNKYVEQAIKQIREHYKEDINISTVAEQLQISEGYLSRVFKKETDYTFTTYLSYYRMKVAMELLKEGNLKVYEVADAAGYSDTAYFSAQFKKIVGIAPSEYQDRVRNEKTHRILFPFYRHISHRCHTQYKHLLWLQEKYRLRNCKNRSGDTLYKLSPELLKYLLLLPH
jgi:two-component system response regulator YesN